MAVLDLIAPDDVAVMIDTRTAATPSVQAVRGEYLEIPMLSLTRAQVQSFWGLDDQECDAVLDTLMTSGFLKVSPSGSFIRASAC